jgi:E3 ubiquitin-protein ligase RNF115/126
MLIHPQITTESDPRPDLNTPPTPPDDFRSLHNHNPWGDSDSDPEEADIEEHITRGPGGSVLISRTIRTSTPHGAFRTGRRHRSHSPRDDPENTLRDFQQMLGNLMGPGLRQGQPGRSGPDTLFTQGPFGGGFRIGGGGGPGPHIVGGRFTYTTGRLRPRDADGAQPGAPPVDDLAQYASPSTPPSSNGRSLYIISVTAPPDQLASIIGSIFGPPGQPGDHEARGGVPPGLHGLLGALLNPANARSGDAVYTQEALDQIISNLMEQHPTSNAPGPASPDAIAALPKKKLDEKLLGPEGKGECSVCMDDVHIGDEVVLLPCSHWFHEICAGAWLGEHNTCPICRKGIEGETPPPNSRRSSQNGPTSRNDHRNRRLSITRPRLSRESTSSRNEARLEAIRNSGRLSPTDESSSPTRWQAARDDMGPLGVHRDRGGHRFRRPSDRYPDRDYDMSENQRDSRRGNTNGSDQSRESRRNSHTGGTGGSSGNGFTSWFRDRWPSNNRRNE